MSSLVSVRALVSSLFLVSASASGAPGFICEYKTGHSEAQWTHKFEFTEDVPTRKLLHGAFEGTLKYSYVLEDSGWGAPPERVPADPEERAKWEQEKQDRAARARELAEGVVLGANMGCFRTGDPFVVNCILADMKDGRTTRLYGAFDIARIRRSSEPKATRRADGTWAMIAAPVEYLRVETVNEDGEPIGPVAKKYELKTIEVPLGSCRLTE